MFYPCLQYLFKEIADICQEVDLPPGVLNVLTGYGSEAGGPLASHHSVDKVLLGFERLLSTHHI